MLPIGYELKSMTFGNVDLMKQPLAVALPTTAQTILRVTSSDALIDEKRLVEGSSSSTSLAPGSYELISYTRPCNGNCSNPDAPRDECRLSVTVAAGETLTRSRARRGNLHVEDHVAALETPLERAGTGR
jgi:hypothetical protein